VHNFNNGFFMQNIRGKIWLVITLLLAAMAVSTVIWLRGGFSVGGSSKDAIAYCGTISFADTLKGNSLKGYQVFKANCAACHMMEKEATGPALMGAADWQPYKGFMKQLLIDPKKALTSCNYGQALYIKYPIHHTSFKNTLTKQEIEDVVFMLEVYGKP